MRVLFVYSGNQSSSDSNLILSQANSLIVNGISVELYAIKGHGFFGYIKYIKPLRSHIIQNKYDLIHAHYGLCGLISFFARNRSTKLIVSFMGNDLLGDHSRNGKSTILSNCLVSVNQLYAKYVDYIIVKSTEMASKISNPNLSVIPNGVDMDKFSLIDKVFAMKRVNWDQKFKHIIFVSRPDRPEKNFSLAEIAFKLINNNELQLHFLQNVKSEDVLFYYNASDVCLLTSFHEGSPNVIKEAMACNSPIVSTDVGDVSWVIGNTQGCFICSFDPTDVGRRIKLALEFARSKGHTNGRGRIIELGLDSESVAKRVINVYEKVLTNKI